MSDAERGRDDFLSRWSRRKNAARAGVAPEPEPRAPAAAAVPASDLPAQAEARPPEPLPPVESLTPESDFTPFMRSEVDPGVRQQALRKLFRDPRFNEMDGLDVYISDYSLPDPMPPEWLGQLNQMARLGDYQPPEPEKEPVAEAEGEEPPAQIAQAEQGLEEPPDPGPGEAPEEGLPPPELKHS